MSYRRYLVFLALPLFLGTAVVWAQPPTLLGRLPQTGNAGLKITRKLKIRKKPNPQYTEEARRSGVEGMVVLRVEFRADGTIGDINPVEELPGGLTEKAIEAARLIEFEPQMVDGQPSSKTLMVSYRFNLH